MNSLTLLLFLFAGSGLALVGLSIPLIQRRIKPNRWYGFRTPRTLNDPLLWYEVDAYAGKRLLIAGGVTTIAAIGLYFVPGLSIDGYALAVTFCSLIPLVIGLWQSFRHLNRLDREAQ